MRAYYNENDRKTAAWLKELIKAGLIADGDVDERSICYVEAKDVMGYSRCHWFSGIGGWDYALQLSGWPNDEPIWTGSCPCQPFSVAGKRKGTADKRHLWPEFYRLIKECKPATVIGEQVSGADGYRWLAGVFADLERSGYAVAGADLPAACVGAHGYSGLCNGDLCCGCSIDDLMECDDPALHCEPGYRVELDPNDGENNPEGYIYIVTAEEPK